MTGIDTDIFPLGFLFSKMHSIMTSVTALQTYHISQACNSNSQPNHRDKCSVLMGDVNRYFCNEQLSLLTCIVMSLTSRPSKGLLCSRPKLHSIMAKELLEPTPVPRCCRKADPSFSKKWGPGSWRRVARDQATMLSCNGAKSGSSSVARVQATRMKSPFCGLRSTSDKQSGNHLAYQHIKYIPRVHSCLFGWSTDTTAQPTHTSVNSSYCLTKSIPLECSR